jgi:hypothetical protein
MVSDDPETFADLDGHDVGFWDVVNFVVGAANAWASDNLLGARRQQQDTTAGKLGAATGDLVATIQGGERAVAGGTGVAAGISLSGTGEGAIVGVPLVVVSAPVAVQGFATATEGAAHLGVAAADAIHNAIQSSSSSGKETGSYTNTHESGKTYSGKGDRARSQASGKRVEQQTGDKHTATDWTASPNGREAFKDESRRIDANGGANSSNNHNKIESPGKKFRRKDDPPQSNGVQ